MRTPASTFDGFALEAVDLPEASLRVRHGGSGPPVLLLHGHPRTHATWHRVAPLLAAAHPVVCPDLRGHGRSSKRLGPSCGPDGIARCAVSHAPSCILEVMLDWVAWSEDALPALRTRSYERPSPPCAD